MPQWEGSNRRSRLPSNWASIRRQVLSRDGYSCMHVRQDLMRLCLLPANEVDHIEQGADDDRMEALQSLCPYHHGQKSGREGGIASGIARRAAKKTGARRHPGLLP